MRRGIVALLITAALPATAEAAKFDVDVERSRHGVPTITAKDFPSLAYGYGRALASDNLCILADTYVTVSGERSKVFGPDESYAFRGNGTRANNRNSDFFYKKIIAQGTVERLVAQPPPLGPVPAIKRAVKGYVAGYNAVVRRGRNTDPACANEPWVRPIKAIDAYRRFYQLALLASSGVAIDGIGAAAPALGGRAAAQQRRADHTLDTVDPARFEELLNGIGSNAVAVGKAGSKTGNGLLLGNPHFPWDGSERFYQAHLRIPGKLNVQGASLMGVPLVLIGSTKSMAWSHTVSTARRFVPYQLTPVPGDQHSYLVDGRPEAMTPTTVSIETKGGGQETRTLYDTRYGPVFTSIMGLPLFPWTPATAFALHDANAANFRYLNHFFFTNQARSVAQLDRIERKYLGIPWVNTIAADTTGKAYYADIGSVPNVTNEKIAECSVALGGVTNNLLRVQVLDGARSGCAPADDPAAVTQGVFGPGSLPSLIRDDFVTNGNDSYWLSNPAQPLEGFSRVIGDERTARTLRTRIGIKQTQDRIAAGGYTLRQLQTDVFDNRQYAGELWRDQLVDLCRSSPLVPAKDACDVLAAWDLRDDLDSRGALLFRRFASRVLTNPLSGALPPAPSPFSTPFDVADPVNTPRGLNVGSPLTAAALADAVRDLQGAGIPLDAPLRDFQHEQRGDERIPIHGGPGTLGVFNAIGVVWDPERGYPDVPHGSSYVQAVELRKGKCPKIRTILTYSQSANPNSRWFADQTRLFSRKRWTTQKLC